MIDFHTHILPKIDDGSSNMEETIEMLKEAQKVGFTKIISTSHYIEQYYETSEDKRKEIIDEITQEKLGIEIKLGSEIYITDNMIELLETQKASTINNSKYVLFELPMNTKSANAKSIIYKLIEKDYIPIIAHPERYKYIQENIEYAEELFNMGALFQSNYGSIIGIYGRNAEKTVKKLLKKDLVYFLGTDVHRKNQIYPKIPKVLKKLKKIISDEKVKELTIENAQKVLNNEQI